MVRLSVQFILIKYRQKGVELEEVSNTVIER
jgi:hypothetical protein